MSTFERQYYESETFWQGNMLQDPANRQRIISTSSLIPADTKSLADIGCGNGVFINYLSEQKPGLLLTGVDRSRNALKYVRATTVEAEIENLPFENGSFDCVTCLEVIEHLPVPIYRKSLQELTRIARKSIIISVPYAEKLEESYTRCPSCKTVFNKEIHVRSFQDNDMQDLLSEFGFTCESTQKLNPVEKYWGHRLFRKLFYPEQFTRWESPICPLCGYEEDQDKTIEAGGPGNGSTVVSKRKFISYLTSLPKMFWPKQVNYYWILARYVRGGN